MRQILGHSRCLRCFAKEIHSVGKMRSCHETPNRERAEGEACEEDNDTYVVVAVRRNREIELHLVADGDNLTNTKQLVMPSKVNFRRHYDFSDTSQRDDCNKTP